MNCTHTTELRATKSPPGAELGGILLFMNQKALGILAVVITWLIVVYFIVSMVIFWTAIQRDWGQLSVQVAVRDFVRSLLWIKDLFR